MASHRPFFGSAASLGRRQFLRLASVGGAVVAVAPGLSRVTSAAQRTGTITIGSWQEPSSLNPHLVGTGTGSGYYVHPILEGLAQFDASGNLFPKLAAEIPSLENGG